MTRGELKARRIIVKAVETVKDEGVARIMEIIGYVLAGIALIVMLGSIGTIETAIGYIPKSSIVTASVSGAYIILYALLVLGRKEIDY